MLLPVIPLRVAVGPYTRRMARRPRYGLDIETDTAAGGLDPAVARVIAVAVSTAEEDIVWSGPEATMLAALDRTLAALPPGILVTWNGSAFDLPYLRDRATIAGVELGLELQADPALRRRRPALPGHPFAYRARWHHHAHLDAYLGYRELLAGCGLSLALKATARRMGLDVVEADASAVHRLPREALLRYVASDARLARVLAELRWADLADFVDDLPDRRPLAGVLPAPRLAASGRRERR
jgi:hypothetical protein